MGKKRKRDNEIFIFKVCNLICANCVIPENFPGIKFNDEGVCNHCLSFEKKRNKVDENRERYRQKLLNLIDLLSQSEEPSQLNKRPYDAIMAYSGGKDSTYTLKILKKEFGLRILAVTFNNGFISPKALENIKRVTEELDVDRLLITPAVNTLKKAFRLSARSDLYPLKAMERASSICNTCMNLTKSLVIKYAIEMGIPLIAYGWSPGQAPIQSSIMKLNPSMIRQTQEIIIKILREFLGDDLTSYVLQEKHFKMIERESEKTKKGIFYNIHPLAFFEYNEEKIIMEIKKLGWEHPEDTDTNSTNCLLNAYSNLVHQEQFGYNPYTFEVASLVRGGFMDREDGISKLNSAPDENVINYVKKKLEVNQ